jgi:hypothetical protein
MGKTGTKTMGGVVMKLKIPALDLTRYLKKETRGEYTENERREYLRETSAGSNVYTYWDEFITKYKLPSYEWVVNNIFVKHAITGFQDRHNTTDYIFAPCEVLNIFQFYSTEFIDHIVETINKLAPQSIVEVGAGDGFLSYFLRECGVDIVPTDDYSRPHINRPERVEKIGHKDALRKYNPDLVVINWEEHLGRYSIDVLGYPSVKHLLWIGEDERGCTGSEELWEFDYENTDNPYCLSRSDEYWLLGDGVRKHTYVMLFNPKRGENT